MGNRASEQSVVSKVNDLRGDEIVFADMAKDGSLLDVGFDKNCEDLKQAEKMSAYMQNRFEFAGIPRPKLKELLKPIWKKYLDGDGK